MEAIYRRRSVRAYTGEPLTEDVVRELLDAAIQAPSAMNAQPWAFIIVQDRARSCGACRTAPSDTSCAHMPEIPAWIAIAMFSPIRSSIFSTAHPR
jgi:hypothetical protein